MQFLRFRTTAARPGPPLVYLAGGPGGSGILTARGPRFPLFMALREVGDVIAFDQRGTGSSNQIPPLPPSPAAASLEYTRAGLTAFMRAEIARGWPLWRARGVAINAYNTKESAHDLEDLRRALGAETLNLWGISYGTHLALAALKYHGDKINRVALASLEGLDQTVKRPGAIDAYLDRVDAVVASQPAARAACPDLPGLMRRVHAKANADPFAVDVDGPLRLDGFTLQMIAGNMIKNPNTLVMIPTLYGLLDRGETGMLAAIARQLPAPQLSGMGDAMDLASGITRRRLALVEREARTAVLGDALNFPMPHVLGAVPGMDLGDAFRAPIRTDTPALLIAGSLDGRTPLSEQAEVAAQFRRKTQILVENAGHDVLETSPRIAELMLKHFRGEAVTPETITLPPPRFPG